MAGVLLLPQTPIEIKKLPFKAPTLLIAIEEGGEKEV
jgi:hypothetical protein